MFKVNNEIKITQKSSVNSTVNPKATSENINMKLDEITNPEFCKEYGITESQYLELIKKHPNLLQKNKEEISQIILKESGDILGEEVNLETPNISQEKVKADVKNETTSAVHTTEVKETSSSKSLSEIAPDDYNFKDFSKLTVKEQEQELAIELAKNKFIFSDPEAPKDVKTWENLSKEQRDALIKEQSKNIETNGLKSVKYSDKTLSEYYTQKLTELQTANYNGLNFEDFLKQDVEQKDEQIFNFVFSLTKPTDKQKKVLDEANLTTQILVDELKKRNDVDYEHLYKNGNGYILSKAELKEIFIHLNKKYEDFSKKYGKNYEFGKDKAFKDEAWDEQTFKNFIKLQLDGRLENGKISKKEKELLSELTENRLLQKIAESQEPTGALTNFQKSDYGKDFSAVKDPNLKAHLVLEYIKNTAGKDSKKQNELWSNILTDLAKSPENVEVASTLGALYLSGLSEDGQVDAVKNSSSVATTALSANSDKLKPKASIQHAQKLKDITNKDPNFGEILYGLTLDHAGSDQFVHYKAVVDKDTNVSDATKEKYIKLSATDEVSAKDQKEIFSHISDNASIKTSKFAIDRLASLHKENQVYLDKKFSENKELAVYNNQVNTLSKFAKENQVEIAKNRHARFEQKDFSKDEAIKQLKTLSDQIAGTDKDNQLAIHEDMMKSKYSEVQEYTASNINKYDPAVQADALDVVFESNNPAAIENAITSLENAPVYIQEAVVPIILERMAMNGEDVQGLDSIADIRERFFSGKLISKEEFYSLPLQERQEFFKKFFNKLPLEQKLKMLASIPNGSQKKSVYVMIARTDINLFNAIMKDKDRVDMLLSMNMPEDVNNKIINVVKFMAVADIGFQNIARKYEIDYSSNKNSNVKINDYASVPTKFAPNEIYKKDKEGNLLA